MIYEFLKEHGQTSLADLALDLDLHPRKLREKIQEEITRGALIGSRSDGGGYFAITSEQELGIAVAELRSRAHQLFGRAEQLEKNWRDAQQPKLDLG